MRPPLARPKHHPSTPKTLLFLGLSLLLSWIGTMQNACANDQINFHASLQTCRFIAYTPRSFSVREGVVKEASKPSIRKDLEILRPYFNGLITYSSTNGVENVAEIAYNLSYQSVIMGIWDPSSEIEINNAVQAFRKYPDLVAAVIVGNEGLYSKRYSHEDVQQAIKRIKKLAPNMAVTTSEPFFLYLNQDYFPFFRSHDLLMPNIHPVFEKWFNPKELSHGVTMVLNVARELEATYRLPILIKETGLPSGETTQGHSPARQAQFWNELKTRFQPSPTLAFTYFEAFDTPWKPALMATEFPGNHANEAYWGLFTTTGQAKEVVKHLSLQTQVKPTSTPSAPH